MYPFPAPPSGVRTHIFGQGRYHVGFAASSFIGAAEGSYNPGTDVLFSTLYGELHRMAKRELARRGAFASMGVTTLLHEAYLDMSGRGGACFPDEARFMGYAARV